jgi:hypothetical protein
MSIKSDARDEMRFGDSDERELAARLDLADAEENAASYYTPPEKTPEKKKPPTRQDLVELTDDPDLLFADGFDDAILGVVTRCGQPPVVVYDRAKCIDIVEAQMGAASLNIYNSVRHQAEEYFSVNTEGSWVGPRTPAYLTKPE